MCIVDGFRGSSFVPLSRMRNTKSTQKAGRQRSSELVQECQLPRRSCRRSQRGRCIGNRRLERLDTILRSDTDSFDRPWNRTSSASLLRQTPLTSSANGGETQTCRNITANASEACSTDASIATAGDGLARATVLTKIRRTCRWSERIGGDGHGGYERMFCSVSSTIG